MSKRILTPSGWKSLIAETKDDSVAGFNLDEMFKKSMKKQSDIGGNYDRAEKRLTDADEKMKNNNSKLRAMIAKQKEINAMLAKRRHK